jgi:hypothetical protein
VTLKEFKVDGAMATRFAVTNSAAAETDPTATNISYRKGVFVVVPEAQFIKKLPSLWALTEVIPANVGVVESRTQANEAFELNLPLKYMLGFDIGDP